MWNYLPGTKVAMEPAQEPSILYAWLTLTVWGIIIYVFVDFILRRFKVQDFHHRNVVITGCDSGFGYFLSIRLDKMGFCVVAGCLTEEGRDRLSKKTSRRLAAVVLDVTNEKSIKQMVETVKDRQDYDRKGVWGLVNNAGVAGPIGPAEWMTKQDYVSTFEVNLFGMMEITRHFLPLLREGKGRVINMSSANGSTTVPFVVPYTISKYGVEVFSDSLRPEARKYGVSVHIIKPGMFNTDIRQVAPIVEGLERSYSQLEPAVRTVYLPDFVKKLVRIATTSPKASSNVEKVVDAYVHALTARFPRYRYRVGYDAITWWRLLGWLPEFVTDWLYDWVLPAPNIRATAPETSNSS